MSGNSIVGIVMFIALGAVFAGFGGYMWMEQGERIDSYESTEATILSSEVEEHVDRSGEGTSRTYSPEITYEYTIEGETYRNSNIYPGPGETQKGQNWARGIVEDHPKGETATVYYDPEDPSNSFLLKNRELVFLGVSAVGGLFVLVGFGSLVRRVIGIFT